ncbi:terpenoid synthase [Phanerochaete sordida]|uniref:Terpene synthase n=1 Tax=Phanerochaete sordida TaxID=48140 RepID=A0A9P3FXR2_9APHY|nr:terpenoid synthase [Phanerochaete sordida]
MSSAPAAPRSYRLPDLLAVCPFKARFNVHFEEAVSGAQERLIDRNVLKGNQLEVLKQCNGELLCAWTHHYAGLQQLHTVCDFVNLLFVLDTITDEQNGPDALATGMQFLNTLKDDSYEDGSVLCQMTKDFKRRFFPYSGPATARRFLEHSENYVLGFAREAELREQGVVLDRATYEPYRRENSGTRYAFGTFGYVLGMDLPDEIFEHPVYMEMHYAAVDMVCWSNDLYSYDMEQAMGPLHLGNNILTVLQREEGIDLQAASDRVGEHFSELVDLFNDAKARLPCFGKELDEITANHVMAMEAWVAGNLEWSFATRRYFGKNNVKVRESLVVELSPLKVQTE